MRSHPPAADSLRLTRFSPRPAPGPGFLALGCRLPCGSRSRSRVDRAIWACSTAARPEPRRSASARRAPSDNRSLSRRGPRKPAPRAPKTPRPARHNGAMSTRAGLLRNWAIGLDRASSWASPRCSSLPAPSGIPPALEGPPSHPRQAVRSLAAPASAAPSGVRVRSRRSCGRRRCASPSSAASPPPVHIHRSLVDGPSPVERASSTTVRGPPPGEPSLGSALRALDPALRAVV